MKKRANSLTKCVSRRIHGTVRDRKMAPVNDC